MPIILEKGGMTMANLSHLDVQNLRHLISGYVSTSEKMDFYASQATDPKIRKFFEEGSKNANKSKQDLLTFLN